MSAAKGNGRLAPVVPLFGDGRAWVGDGDDASATESQTAESEIAAPVIAESEIAAREIAERDLLKKLRTRQLSEKEARALVAERGLEGEQIDAVITAFRSRGYIDDGRLAEQLVHTGVDRKRQGRRAIAMTMTQRGIPRSVADAALSALPDDDAERALEYARRKAATMRGLDRAVALRRLAGQLARRGHPGALEVARRALEEES